MVKINLENVAFVLTLLLPFAIIIGQAPSDILVSSISILFLINSLVYKDWSWIKIKWVKIIFFIWFYLIFASLLSLDKSIGISHSILFLRFFLFAIALQYWVLSKPKYLKILLYFLTIGFTFVLFDTLIQFLNFDMGLTLKESRRMVSRFSATGRDMTVQIFAPNCLIGPKLIVLI